MNAVNSLLGIEEFEDVRNLEGVPCNSSANQSDSDKLIESDAQSITTPVTEATAELDIELDNELEGELIAKLNSLSFSLQYRYLITQIEHQQFAFPLNWVADLILIEQSQILSLPFYGPMLLGVLHYRGEVVPLVVAPLTPFTDIATVARRLRTKHTVTAVRLNQSVGKLAGIGIVVDRVIERMSSVPASVPAIEPPSLRVFQLEDIPASIWQPR
ncbi:chemotaxis protein CheW [Thermocoleostomius sinensis]|uniref:Chemotaxis protein CheW n=1 Tax=Thermocoleostomius sinensis A174 TaxID=2016057 RepID=A0A9E8ZHL7_9CYAN|nr:chemotaxis protein CheW [Thermocoleostomius sinensis]WAL61902.1 chemotaxis protein CheW [Thermocoleostomius sinensis A174]